MEFTVGNVAEFDKILMNKQIKQKYHCTLQIKWQYGLVSVNTIAQKDCY